MTILHIAKHYTIKNRKTRGNMANITIYGLIYHLLQTATKYIPPSFNYNINN